VSGRKPVLGFIGIGLMGTPMTIRLLDAGYEVHVWNRSKDKLRPVVAKGAKEAADVASVARSADITILCVRDVYAVEDVVFGAEGIVAGAGKGSGKLLVDCSSIPPDRSRQLAKRLKDETGLGWVDAPVSGGVPGAENGTLAIYCGGVEADVERARPVFGAFATNVTRMGDSGAGQMTKLCSQLIVGTNLALIAEAISLGRRNGIDVEKLPAAFKGGFADSIPLQIFGPLMVKPGRKMGEISTMLKDLDTVTSAARMSGSPVPLVSTAAEIYRYFVSHGRTYEDIVVLADYYGQAEKK
jgi:3-hydroxyisobutyrate dehydrogenase-like beta-hydroxyacid dehydrogenase